MTETLIALKDKRNCLEAKRHKLACQEQAYANEIHMLIVQQAELEEEIQALNTLIAHNTEMTAPVSWFCRLKTR